MMAFVPPNSRKESQEASYPKKYPFSKESVIVVVVLAGIGLHVVLRYQLKLSRSSYEFPLLAVLILGGLPLVYELALKALHKEFGSDLLAGISIITSAILGEYLAGSLVVLMLSGGRVMESYVVRKASSVLEALSKRMPNIAHHQRSTGIANVILDEVRIGNILVVFPHEVCPVDGVVINGSGIMDESYLTGEPFMISKTSGSNVLSGSINGDSALTIRATQLAVDSRYANIMKVMRSAQQHRPHIRRLGDQLGAVYTPLAVAAAIAAWCFSGDSIRFLAVLVIATPCPLLIAIPVSVIGSISLAAKRGIIIKDPSVLEQIGACRTMIFDKTGTLTYGVPELTEQLVGQGFDASEVLRLVASVEQYSKHPLARAILAAARKFKLPLAEAEKINEPPGQGLEGVVLGRKIRVTNRRSLIRETGITETSLPPPSAGLECVIAIDGAYAATYRFHDSPRSDSNSSMKGIDLVARRACIFGSGDEQPGHVEEGSAMTKETFHILIVGQQGPFREIFNHLDEQGSYQLHFAWDYEAARSYLTERTPSAIILTIRVDERNFEEEMEWLEIMKKHAPVIVLAPVEDLHLYKTVMHHGAFDFFTAFTPPDEIDRELNNAITLQTCQVA